MEDFEPRWKAVEELLKDRFEKMPDLEGILFLIGVNEFGHEPKRKTFTKEQKQDLMHIAVCTLLSQVGVYQEVGRDEDGWPHFEKTGEVPVTGLMPQEQLLKECIIRYFGL